MPLAPYHLSVKTVSRAKGRSAVAAAAYRSGERLVDENAREVFDYSRRGGVERPDREIFAPEEAPAWVQDRQALWNKVEQAETRKNSTVAREFEVALPADLDGQERRAIVRAFGQALVERHGIVVDASIHGPDEEAQEGRGNRNHHAHILCSTRRIGADGFGEKTRELDNQRSGLVEEWRATFAGLCADALERAGHDVQAGRWRAGHLDKAGQLAAARERGDAAFVAANEDRVPTKHYGPNIINIERKNGPTVRGELAREPERRNAKIIDLAEARKRLGAELAADRSAEPAPPPAERRAGLLDAARGDRPRLLDAPPAPIVRAPAIVLREWRGEVDRQFGAVRGKAERVDRYARQLLARHERRREEHRQDRPAEPTGLFAAAKRRTHEVAAKAWEQTRAAIQKRIDRLVSHINRIAGYMRRATAWDGRPSPGEALAERKAGAANPALATEASVAIEQQRREQQERDAQQLAQATARRHHHYHGQERDMTDANRGAAGASDGRQRREAEERARLERDGKLAQRQNETLDQEKAEATASKPAQAKDGQQPETDQERKVREAREAIRRQRGREREEQDRDRTRGRGR